MFKNSDAFDLFLSELLDEKLRRLTKTDSRYASLKSKAAAESGAIQEQFSQSDLALLDKIETATSELVSIEHRALYFEGFRDCIYLLKRLEVY